MFPVVAMMAHPRRHLGAAAALQEDLDGDGVAAWEDCDDSDPLAWDAASGQSAACAAESCLTILNDGYSTGDGTYWIDPDGSGAFEGLL